MKKIVLGAAFVAAACFGTFTANQSNNQALLSDLQLDNVEVFGQDEGWSSLYPDYSDYYEEIQKKIEDKRGLAGTNWFSYSFFCENNDMAIACVMGIGGCLSSESCD